jgi:hypothetical protein
MTISSSVVVHNSSAPVHKITMIIIFNLSLSVFLLLDLVFDGFACSIVDISKRPVCACDRRAHDVLVLDDLFVFKRAHVTGQEKKMKE